MDLREADPGSHQLDPGRFFSRRRLSFVIPPAPWIPAEAPNLDELAFLPVAAGYWRQHELWDGTYTLDDLLDVVELIHVSRENQRRAATAAGEIG